MNKWFERFVQRKNDEILTLNFMKSIGISSCLTGFPAFFSISVNLL